jgi:preprotein translocase subunit SecB
MSETVADGQAAAAPSLIINAQYLRDLSFENPRAPESLLGQNAPPDVSINADVRARQLGEDVFEVVIDLKVEARQGEEVGFLIEVSYGAVATIKNAPQELMAALILIEVPRILFPFARNIVADATRDGGFPPLLINPIDFGEIQRRKAQEGQAVAGNA